MIHPHNHPSLKPEMFLESEMFPFNIRWDVVRGHQQAEDFLVEHVLAALYTLACNDPELSLYYGPSVINHWYESTINDLAYSTDREEHAEYVGSIDSPQSLRDHVHKHVRDTSVRPEETFYTVRFAKPFLGRFTYLDTEWESVSSHTESRFSLGQLVAFLQMIQGDPDHTLADFVIEEHED